MCVVSGMMGVLHIGVEYLKYVPVNDLITGRIIVDHNDCSLCVLSPI